MPSSVQVLLAYKLKLVMLVKCLTSFSAGLCYRVVQAMLPGCAGYVNRWVGGELKNKANLSQAKARARLLGLSLAIRSQGTYCVLFLPVSQNLHI